jgi:rubrerythrin
VKIVKILLIYHTIQEKTMSKTVENLLAAFAGESQANRKYLAFAQRAEREGYTQVARLFRAAAEAETIHAHNHLRALSGINSTAENLEVAIAGENYEAVTMYPDFLGEANTAENSKAIRTFKYALAAEKVHEQMYREALENLGKEEESYDYYVCPACGHTHARVAPDECPVCGVKGQKFILVQ